MDSEKEIGTKSNLNFLGRLTSLNIRGRLIMGFTAITAVLVIAISTTVWKVNSISARSELIVDLRVPTSATSQGMVNDINASLAALRGWMLTGNPNFKTERAAVWEDIDRLSSDMDRFSAKWTVPANVKKWNEMKVTLSEFRIAQKQVEDIANTTNEHPANRILFEEAAPMATIMMSNITKMIDLEMGLDANRARKGLLGIMADVRGSTAISLANIRAYLLSGEQKFKDAFLGSWAKNTRRFADLQSNSGLLGPIQTQAFVAFSEARETFSPMPDRMFEIRGSNKWNMANYTLITEAAPRAGKILDTLVGPKAADGSRTGGMVANQKGLLSRDAAAAGEDISSLLSIVWILLTIGVVSSVIVVFFTSRSIVDPIAKMTDAMARLAGGDNTIEIPATERTDEIGEMAQAVQVFKDSSIENDRLAAEAKLAGEREEERKVKDAKEKEVERERAEAEASETRKKWLDEMTNKFDKDVQDVVSAVTAAATELESTASGMSSLAEGTQSQAGNSVAASEQATSNVQAVASASEEMIASIGEISRQVSKSSEVTANAVKEADEANDLVQQLDETAQEIGEVISFITDIATQTNLLALNATIEAARAGDAGKGFAVVASEVKELADQTGKATEEISAKISAIQDRTKETTKAMKRIRKVIQETNEVTATIAAAMEEQNAASAEISRNAQEAAVGTQSASENMAKVSEGAAETKDAANQVLDASQELAKNGSRLTKAIDGFLTEIKAA